MIKIWKDVGETPLECLERYRAERVAGGQIAYADIPMTYAGRLDPMAEGELLILIGDECKDKQRYLGLGKEYEVEIVFGISTDTYDALGLAAKGKIEQGNRETIQASDLHQYIGRFNQPYPPFSSKTVNGKQLHELARSDDLPDEMPEKEVEIYSLEAIGHSRISGQELKTRILNDISLVKGDFRQGEIRKRWNEVLDDPARMFPTMNIRVKCSSGTYMRSLADRMGKDAGTGAFALSIKRAKIFI